MKSHVIVGSSDVRSVGLHLTIPRKCCPINIRKTAILALSLHYPSGLVWQTKLFWNQCHDLANVRLKIHNFFLIQNPLDMAHMFKLNITEFARVEFGRFGRQVVFGARCSNAHRLGAASLTGRHVTHGPVCFAHCDRPKQINHQLPCTHTSEWDLHGRYEHIYLTILYGLTVKKPRRKPQRTSHWKLEFWREKRDGYLKWSCIIWMTHSCLFFIALESLSPLSRKVNLQSTDQVPDNWRKGGAMLCWKLRPSYFLAVVIQWWRERWVVTLLVH